MAIEIKRIYKNDELESLAERTLPILGNVKFNDLTWVCDRFKRSAVDKASSYKLYFSKIPTQFVVLLKYAALIRFANNSNFDAVSNMVKKSTPFFKYLHDNKILLKDINFQVIENFKKFLNSKKISEYQKNTIWSSIKIFLKVIKELDGAPKMNYFDGKNPFMRIKKRHNEKYMPKYVTRQMDRAFKDEKIPLFVRSIYWVLRSIPSRIGEVLDTPLDCIKSVTEDLWVAFIPTWKQAGGYDSPQIRRIYFKDVGHGAFFKNLITEQQKTSKNLQEYLDENKRNLLFARKIVKTTNKGVTYELSKPTITSYDAICRAFNKVVVTYDIRDEKGELYKFTTHQLRHNGITDRLYQGFSLIQTTLMTGHQGTVMLQTAYNHPQESMMIDVQKSVHKVRENKEEPAVLFKGKILNMDEATEKRLLQDIRSRRIPKLGICRDFTGCNSFQCLTCDNCIPDTDDLPYHEEQIKIYKEKLAKIGNHKYLKDNIEYNLSLHESVIKKIKTALSTGGDKVETTS